MQMGEGFPRERYGGHLRDDQIQVVFGNTLISDRQETMTNADDRASGCDFDDSHDFEIYMEISNK